MSGQETETGEVPPTYGEAVAHVDGRADRSAPRAGDAPEGSGRGVSITAV